VQNQTITKATPTTTLVSSLNPSTHGQLVTFTATVTPPYSGTPTGTVTFLDNGVAKKSSTLSGGTATWTTSTLTVGMHPITATYNGSSSFNSSSTALPLNQTVNP
jgi:hypothetical protein